MSAPKFNAMVAAVAQWAVDFQNQLAAMPGAFDVDEAIGAQLDVDGEWIGASRNLAVPLNNVYFSLDDANLGLDQGSLMGPFDPTSGLVSLPDDQYRVLLYATIAANQWDGTVPGAYDAWNTAFEPLGYGILIQDNLDMTISIALIGPAPDAITKALFTGGHLNLRPASVQVISYLVPSVGGVPIFGLDIESSAIAGLDVGALAAVLF